MRTIKTRKTVKNVKVLDKSISASKRMKDAFIRTKNKAEETQNSSHATPTDYASDNIQITARGAAEETAQYLPTPRRVNNARHKASDNWNRAKGHFQEVKRQMPKQRQQAVVQANKTAQTTKTNAIKLRSEADHAFNRAREAKAAVKDAKLALKQVKQTGRQSLREVTLDTRQKMKILHGEIMGSRPIQTPVNTTAGSISDTSHPVSDLSNTATKNIKLPRQRTNAIKMRNSTLQASNPISVTADTPNIEISRPATEVANPLRKNIKIPRQRANAIKTRNSTLQADKPINATANNPNIEISRPTSEIVNPPPKNSKLPQQRANAVKTRNSTLQTSKPINTPTANTLNSEVSRNASEVVNPLPKNGRLPDQSMKAIKTQGTIKPIDKPPNAPKINVGRGVTPVSELSEKSFVSQGKLRLSNLKPFRRKSKSPKAPEAKTAAPVDKPAVIDGTTIKDGAIRSSYKNAVPKSADKAANTLQKSAEAVKSTKKAVKETAKGTVKTAKKSVKTAEKSAKAAVKTAQHTAKTAQKTAKAAAKTAKTAERAARVAAKTAVQTAKVAAKAITAMAKAAIAAVKGIVSAIIAGGWIAVLVILIICMIGLLVGSIYGIFFSSEPSEGGKTINTVIAEINAEYIAEIDGITSTNAYDLIDMSGARASWKQVLAVYTVKTVTDPDNPMEVATMNDEKAAILKTIFWEMNSISYTLDTVDVEEDVLDDEGLPTGETETVTKTVLRITVTHKTPDEMAVQYGFSDEQNEWLEELLKPEYHSLWNSLLYGISAIGDGSMIEIADTQIGNVGGEPYWSWYGFTSRVEWCACFVSWVAEQCGYIDAGIMPRFSGCMNGVQWFKDRGQWQDNIYTPRPGDIIFFDWEPDGTSDHVGIVESVADGRVNTIEGNSGDVCCRQSYDLGSVKIYGYGVPAYN